MEIDDITQDGQYLCKFLTGTADYSNIGDRSSVNLSLVVASALFERATRLLGGVNSERAADPEFLRRIASLETIIEKFNNALARGVARQAMSSTALTVEERRMFVTARSLGQVSIIQLHNLLAESASANPGVRKRSHGLCLKSAREVAGLVQQLDEDDVAYLNPIVGVAWLSASRTLRKEVGKLQEVSKGRMTQEAKQIAAEVDLVGVAMNKLGRSCPLFAYQTTGNK